MAQQEQLAWVMQFSFFNENSHTLISRNAEKTKIKLTATTEIRGSSEFSLARNLAASVEFSLQEARQVATALNEILKGLENG